MKVLILLAAAMLLGACSTTPTAKSVTGKYSLSEGQGGLLGGRDDGHLVLKENGSGMYVFGEWEKTNNGEIHISGWTDPEVAVFRVHEDGSLIYTAGMANGKREEYYDEEDDGNTVFRKEEESTGKGSSAKQTKKQSVLGEYHKSYEGKITYDVHPAFILMKNGVVAAIKFEWEIRNNSEVHLTTMIKGGMFTDDWRELKGPASIILKINSDGNLTGIAYIIEGMNEGKRTEVPKKEQKVIKKIK